jgi:hypothetical protein
MPRSVDTSVSVLPSGLALATGIGIAERDSAQAINNPEGDVTWIRPETGNIAGYVAVYRPDAVGAPTTHQAELATINPDDTLPARSRIICEIDNVQSFFNRIYAEVRDKDNAHFDGATIINAIGGSDFMQLAEGTVKRKIAYGSDSFTWTASNTSAIKSINHGLGVAPIITLATMAGAACVIQAGFNSTNIKFEALAQTNDLAVITATLPFAWLAIG